MALQETPPNGRSPPRPSGRKTSAAIPNCPQCERRMTIKQVAPVLKSLIAYLRAAMPRLREMRNGSKAHRDASLSRAHLI